MARTDGSKDKGKGIEGASSSRSRRQAPISPESGTLVPIPANPQNAFPFTARMRLTNSMKEREARLKNFKVLNTIYPDVELLENLGILEEVEDIFDNNGFEFVFEESPPLVYELLVREFIYSFVPEWRVVKRQNSEFYVPEKHVVSWTFRLGGVEYTYSRNDLLRALDLPDHTAYPFVRKSVQNRFWRLITGNDSDFVPAEHETKIINPVWRLVHRFIATCIILRMDEGRWVSKSDFELMCSFHEDISFDLLTVITRSLEESTTPTFRGKYLTGGPFVTMLAKDIGFSLDPNYAMPPRVMGEEDMIRRGFVKIKRTQEGVVRLLVGRDTPPTEPKTPAPTIHTHEEAGPSHTAERPITMEDLSAQLHTLTTYTHDGFHWAGNMFQGLYTRMGYDGYVPPPPHPYHTPHPPTDQAGTSAGAGGGVNEETEDETDDEDEMDEDTDASFSI